MSRSLGLSVGISYNFFSFQVKKEFMSHLDQDPSEVDTVPLNGAGLTPVEETGHREQQPVDEDPAVSSYFPSFRVGLIEAWQRYQKNLCPGRLMLVVN